MELDAKKMTDDVQCLIDYLDEDQQSQSSKKASKIQLIATEYNKIVDDDNIRLNSTMKEKLLVLNDKVSSKSAQNGSKNELAASENRLTECKKCSFSYNKKSKEDVQNHEAYHNEFLTFSWVIFLVHLTPILSSNHILVENLLNFSTFQPFKLQKKFHKY